MHRSFPLTGWHQPFARTCDSLLLLLQLICTKRVSYITLMAAGASSILGTIGEYQPENKLFSSYSNESNCFNDIKGVKQVPVFLSLLGNNICSSAEFGGAIMSAG